MEFESPRLTKGAGLGPAPLLSTLPPLGRTVRQITIIHLDKIVQFAMVATSDVVPYLQGSHRSKGALWAGFSSAIVVTTVPMPDVFMTRSVNIWVLIASSVTSTICRLG